MEIILELVLELLGDSLLQLLGQAVADSVVHFWRRQIQPAHMPHPLMLLLGYALLGLIAGGMSLWVLPHALTHSDRGRWLTLIFSPLASGLTMWLLARLRGKRDPAENLFMDGVVFAFAMGLVRFIFTQ
jgi:Co/Zn/Cd efflux system component